MSTKERMRKRQQRLNIFVRIDELLTQTCEECQQTMNADLASRYECDCPASLELRKLGLKLGGLEKVKTRPFTEKDDRMILKHYPELSGSQIAKLLNRTRGSIYTRVKILKQRGIF